MRKFIAVPVLWVFVVCAGLVYAAPPEKATPGTLVIVFKDGHRQSFNLAEVDRVEYPAGTMAASDLGGPSKQAPPRGRFIGKWECGDGNGGTFYITLNENGDAYRSIHGVRGHWVYFNGDALITWDDGAQDAIRREGSRFQKFAYSAGKKFTDEPDNVAEAHNTSPRPI